MLPAALAWLLAGPVQAQNRGVYPLGLSAINSGVSAQAGYTYNNSFLYYSRNEQKGGHGEVLATGQQSVLLDMNTVLWASPREIALLGDAGFATAVTIPIASNSLSSSGQGAISGGGGLGIFIFSPSFLPGARSAPTSAAFSACLRLPAHSALERPTMSATGTGRR